MKLCSMYELLDTPHNLKCKQIYCSKYLQMEALGGVGFTHYIISNHYFLTAVVQIRYVKNPVSLSRFFFFFQHQISSFFMHIFSMSVIHLQSVEKIQWKLYEELISQSMHYQPLFTRCSCRNMAKLKTLSVCQKIFFQHQTSSCISSICL